jgi:hypothetical protein
MSEDIKSGQAEMKFIVNAWIADMKEDRKGRTACQEATEANPEKMEPIDRAITILEKMEATDLKANP